MTPSTLNETDEHSIRKNWAHQDSNLGPSGYEGSGGDLQGQINLP